MVKRFVGSGRAQEGGVGATHKQDFNAHVTGGDWRHEANQVDVSPTVAGASNVQTALQALEAASIDSAFVTIGEGFNGCVGDFADAFNDAFANPELANGGTIIIRSGTYCMQSTVTVPNGIVIMGERDGVTIIGEMSEVPMFTIQEATVKNDIQPSVIEVDQPDFQNGFVNVKLYDNLNGTVASGGPSMSTIPMIQMQHGANLRIEKCSFIGRAVTGPVSVTHRVIAFTGLTTAGVGTTLHVNDCYIDGIKTAIDFDARQGDLDYLTVTNNRARTFGDGGLGTVQDRFFVTFVNCNANISENFHKGLNTTWGAEGFAYIKDIVTVNNDISINLNGNSGGLDAAGSNVFLVDARTSPANLRSTALSNWGTHHTAQVDIGLFTDDVFVVSGASITSTLTVQGNDLVALNNTTTLGTDIGVRRVQAGQYIVLQDSDFGNNVVCSAGRAIIDCRSVTTFGDIRFLLDYVPLDGETLRISVINHPSQTPSITRFRFDQIGNVAQAGFFRNAEISDLYCPDPRPGAVTEFEFTYNSIVNYFTMIAKNVTVYDDSSPLPYDNSSLLGQNPFHTNEPQASHSIIGDIVVPSLANENSTFDPISRPVYCKNNHCVVAVDRTGFCRYSDNGSVWGPVGGSPGIVSSDAVIAAGDEGSTTRVAIVSQGGTSVETFSLGRGNGGLPSAGGLTSFVAADAIINWLYQGPGSNRFIVATTDGIWQMNTPYTGLSNQQFAGQSIRDVARAPDGSMMAVAVGSGNVYYYGANFDFTTAPTFNLVASGVNAGDIFHVSYNRSSDRWVIVASNGFVMTSGDNGVTWDSTGVMTAVTTNPNLVQMVGNATVISSGLNTSGASALVYSNEPENLGSWFAISHGDGLFPEPGHLGISWVAGKLVSTNRPNGEAQRLSSLISSSKAGIYGLTDFDK